MLGEKLLFFSTALMIHLFRQSTCLAAEVPQAGDGGAAPPQMACSLPLRSSPRRLLRRRARNEQLRVNGEVAGASLPRFGRSHPRRRRSSPSECHDVPPRPRQQHTPQCSPTVHSATESTYSGSPQRYRPGFGNVGTAGAAGAPVAAVLGALAEFVAAAGCIPQCFAVAD